MLIFFVGRSVFIFPSVFRVSRLDILLTADIYNDRTDVDPQNPFAHEILLSLSTIFEPAHNGIPRKLKP